MKFKETTDKFVNILKNLGKKDNEAAKKGAEELGIQDDLFEGSPEEAAEKLSMSAKIKETVSKFQNAVNENEMIKKAKEIVETKFRPQITKITVAIKKHFPNKKFLAIAISLLVIGFSMFLYFKARSQKKGEASQECMETMLTEGIFADIDKSVDSFSADMDMDGTASAVKKITKIATVVGPILIVILVGAIAAGLYYMVTTGEILKGIGIITVAVFVFAAIIVGGAFIALLTMKKGIEKDVDAEMAKNAEPAEPVGAPA